MVDPNVPLLRHGARGPFVTELQTILNATLTPTPGLATTGVLDPPTERAVRRYQTERWLVSDGVVGRCTWNALKDWEEYAVYPTVNLVAQPTPDTCWAASTAMMLGRAQPVRDELGIYTPGGIPNDGEVSNPATTARYYRHWGLTLHHAQSWTARGLARLMRTHGALLLNVLWDARGYTTPDPANPGQYRGSSGHYVVMSGMRGDGTEDGTTVRIHNPLPVGQGRIVAVNYARMMRSLPAATYQVCHR